VVLGIPNAIGTVGQFGTMGTLLERAQNGRSQLFDGLIEGVADTQ